MKDYKNVLKNPKNVGVNRRRNHADLKFKCPLCEGIFRILDKREHLMSHIKRDLVTLLLSPQYNFIKSRAEE